MLYFPWEAHVTSKLQKYGFSLGFGLVTGLTICFSFAHYQSFFVAQT